MAGNTLIDLMTTGFGLITAGIIVVFLYRMRRWPIVALIRQRERRVALHSEAMRMLAVVMDDARTEGRQAQFERLAATYSQHRASLKALDPTCALPDRPRDFAAGPAPLDDSAIPLRRRAG